MGSSWIAKLPKNRAGSGTLPQVLRSANPIYLTRLRPVSVSVDQLLLGYGGATAGGAEAYDEGMFRRRARAWWKYAQFLSREFRWPVLVFLVIVFGGGLLVRLTYTAEPLDYAKAC